MNIHHVRHTFTDESTISSVDIDGVFECFILENPLKLSAQLGPEHIAVQYGIFPVKVRYSDHFKRRVLELQNVPDRTNIEVHAGNTSADTKGCLCPGKTRAKNFIGDSQAAEAALFTKVATALARGEEVFWTIAPIQTDTDKPKAATAEGAA